MEHNKKNTSPRIRNLIAFSTFIMLLFGIIVLYQAFRDYDDATERGRENAERLVNILSDQIELTFLTVDLALQRATERQYFNMLFGGNLPEDMVHNFNVWVENTPQMVSIALINEKGDVEMAVHKQDYEGWLDYNSNISSSEPFRKLKNNNDITTYIAPHFDNGVRHRNLILVAKRVDKLDGTFGGIVVAAVYGEYFLDFFASIDSGFKRYISLFLEDGRDLFEGTVHKRHNGAMNNILRPKMFASNPDIVETSVDKYNDSVNILAVKHFDKLPIVAAVMLDEDDFLSAFWQERLKDISFLILFTVFGSVLSFFALTMARQITRVEESEGAAILASQAKSEFLANMSHELRTPLNAIIGFSEMMNSGYFGPLNAKQKERMHDINLCGNHLLHLITDILEFSKGEAGKLEVVEERVDIAEIIDEASRMLNEKARSKSVKLVTDVSPNLPPLFADKRKIKQILINLVSNATKFTPQNGIISVEAKLDTGGALHLVVADSGIGIAEEDISKALSVFGQVHRSKSHEGTGLGLPLCKMFAELHGGQLNLTSVVGEGTTVRVIFPAERVMDENYDPVEASAAVGSDAITSPATFKVGV